MATYVYDLDEPSYYAEGRELAASRYRLRRSRSRTENLSTSSRPEYSRSQNPTVERSPIQGRERPEHVHFDEVVDESGLPAHDKRFETFTEPRAQSQWQPERIYVDVTEHRAGHRALDEKSSWESAAVMYNITHDTDTTFHLELETMGDISAELEVFSRFCRLGNFSAAEHHYTHHLNDDEDNAYVRTQYAQMLLDLGGYKDLESLETPERGAFASHRALKSNWNLIKAAGMMHSADAASEMTFERYCCRYIAKYTRSDDQCATTELQKLCISLHNLSYAKRYESGVGAGLTETVHKVIPYETLLQNGRIWDYRDIIVSLIRSDPKMTTLSRLYSARDACELYDIVSKYWDVSSHDETTKLALLDIGQTLMMNPELSPEEFRRLLNKTTSIISLLLQHDPGLVTTRQYLRWMLMKSCFEASTKGGVRHFAGPNDGIYILRHHSLYAPLYVPLRAERPESISQNYQSNSISLIETALESAKSLGDYETEALCLKALALQSENTMAVLQELTVLQKDVQGDIQGCLETYLTMYTFLPVDDTISRAALKDQIIDLRCGENFPNALSWARAMVLRALSTSIDEASFYLSIAIQYGDRLLLPQHFRRFMYDVRQSLSPEERTALEAHQGILESDNEESDLSPRFANSKSSDRREHYRYVDPSPEDDWSPPIFQTGEQNPDRPRWMDSPPPPAAPPPPEEPAIKSWRKQYRRAKGPVSFHDLAHEAEPQEEKTDGDQDPSQDLIITRANSDMWNNNDHTSQPHTNINSGPSAPVLRRSATVENVEEDSESEKPD